MPNTLQTKTVISYAFLLALFDLCQEKGMSNEKTLDLIKETRMMLEKKGMIPTGTWDEVMKR